MSDIRDVLIHRNLGFCALDPCTNATLASITTTIANNCGPEFGISPGDTSQLVRDVQVAFPPVRKVLCLKQYVRLVSCKL